MVLESLVIYLKNNKEFNIKVLKKLVNAFRPWCGENLSKYNTKYGGHKRKDWKVKQHKTKDF